MTATAQNVPSEILTVLDLHVWAVVGLSDNTERPAYGVAEWLVAKGRQIVPINPKATSVHGGQGYSSLAEVPFPIDVVDIFRRSDQAGAHVDEAIAIGAKAVWLQLGVVDEAAAERARAAGLLVVMDTCPKIEAPLLGWKPAAA
jgi:predicted CoA-binding protein